jgi:hypothetical protein
LTEMMGQLAAEIEHERRRQLHSNEIRVH